MVRQKLKLGRLARLLLTYLLLFFTLILVLLPLMWAAAASFTPGKLIYKYTMPFSIRALWPVDFTLENYRIVLFGSLHVEGYVLRSLMNSLMLSSLRVILGISVSAPAAFAIARLRFFGRRFFFIFLILPFLLGGSKRESLIIPAYIMARDLHLENTYLALILPGLASVMVIFLFIQFFKGIPGGIIDAALMDGASWFQVLTRIVLPISKPVLISGVVLLFLGQWNDFFWPLLVASAPSVRVITVAVSFLNPGQRVYQNLVLAGSMLAAIVPVLVFLPLQRYYIAGIIKGSVKG